MFQCYLCLGLKNIYTRLNNFFFSFSLSQYCSPKRIGGASLETDEKDWEVCHSRQMGKILDQGTICMLYYSAVLEDGCDEQLCEQALVWGTGALGCASIDTCASDPSLTCSLPRLVEKKALKIGTIFCMWKNVHLHNIGRKILSWVLRP